MNTVKSHLIRHPHARGTRIAYLQQRDAMTDRLRRELQDDAKKRLNEFRDDIGYVSWFRRMFRWGR